MKGKFPTLVFLILAVLLVFATLAILMAIIAGPVAALAFLLFAILGLALPGYLLIEHIARSPPVASSAKAFGGNEVESSCKGGRRDFTHVPPSNHYTNVSLLLISA